MNKKGFTLIELLAVIVILAIIALIATPIIIGIIEDARESSNERSVELYADAIKQAIARYQIENPTAKVAGTFTQSNNGRTLSNGELTLTVDYDGDVECSVIEVAEAGELILDECKVNQNDTNYSYDEENGVTGDENEGEGEIADPIAFSSDSWSTIIANVQNGNTDAYNVGDTKSIDMGTFGVHTVRVANKSNDATVCTQETNSSGATYSKTACGFVIEFVDIITYKRMNSTDTNVGGWPASAMRTYVNNDIFNALPSELKNAIIDTAVISGYGKDDSPNKESTDKLYLLSTAEVYQDGQTNDTARELTRQLDYYENLGVTTNNYSGAIKQYNGSNSGWWLRSAYSSGPSSFYAVTSYGPSYHDGAFVLHGVAPAFRIG